MRFTSNSPWWWVLGAGCGAYDCDCVWICASNKARRCCSCMCHAAAAACAAVAAFGGGAAAAAAVFGASADAGASAAFNATGAGASLPSPLVLLSRCSLLPLFLCSLLCNKEQHDVRPHTPYKQHDLKYLPPPKRNVRALQPIKVKIDRRVMCPWGGEKRNRHHRRRREKNCVCGNGTRF